MHLLLGSVLCRVEMTSPYTVLYTFASYIKACQLPSTCIMGRVHRAAPGSFTSPCHFPKAQVATSLWHSPIHSGSEQLILAVC